MASAAKTLVQMTLDLSGDENDLLASAHHKEMVHAMEQRATTEIDILTNVNLFVRDGGTAEAT